MHLKAIVTAPIACGKNILATRYSCLVWEHRYMDTLHIRFAQVFCGMSGYLSCVTAFSRNSMEIAHIPAKAIRV